MAKGSVRFVCVLCERRHGRARGLSWKGYLSHHGQAHRGQESPQRVPEVEGVWRRVWV